MTGLHSVRKMSWYAPSSLETCRERRGHPTFLAARGRSVRAPDRPRSTADLEWRSRARLTTGALLGFCRLPACGIIRRGELPADSIELIRRCADLDRSGRRNRRWSRTPSSTLKSVGQLTDTGDGESTPRWGGRHDHMEPEEANEKLRGPFAIDELDVQAFRDADQVRRGITDQSLDFLDPQVLTREQGPLGDALELEQ
jgi:hypothetical protein